MRPGTTVDVTSAVRARLLAIATDPQQPTEARLARSDRAADRRRPRHGRDYAPGSVAKTAVRRWQERFMLAGVDGSLRDKTRRRRRGSKATEVELGGGFEQQVGGEGAGGQSWTRPARRRRPDGVFLTSPT